MKGVGKIISVLCFLYLPAIAMAQGNEYKLDEVYKIKDNGKIELYTDDADIQITGTDRSDVRVKVYYRLDTRGFAFGNKEFELDISESGGDLIIRENSYGSTGVFFGTVTEQYEITIYAPKGVSLVLKGDDDDYRIRGIDGSIAINSDDADIVITECNGNHFEFDIDDGDLEMDGGSGFLYVRSDDGDLIFRNSKFSEVSAILDDADMLLETSLTDGGDYTFKVDDGDLDMRILDGGGEFDITFDDGRIIATDEFKIVERDEHAQLLRLSDGNARIRMHANDGRVSLSRL
jgi:hypothetical protein